MHLRIFPVAQSQITTVKSSEALTSKLPFWLKFKAFTQPYE